MHITKIKLSNFSSVTPNSKPIPPPIQSPITLDKLQRLMNSAYSVPSTPSLHAPAAFTINGINTS